MSEEWRNVTLELYADAYAVSSIGRVKNLRTGRILKPTPTRVGYYRVGLSVGGVLKYYFVHRLVALAFIPNPLGKPTVNHINEIKTDNRIENLEWATNAEQNVHGTRIQRAVMHTDWKNRGIDYASVAAHHDYTQDHMCGRKKTIAYKDGVELGEFRSQAEAAKWCGVSATRVSMCAKGLIKSVFGFSFRNAV